MIVGHLMVLELYLEKQLKQLRDLIELLYYLSILLSTIKFIIFTMSHNGFII